MLAMATVAIAMFSCKKYEVIAPDDNNPVGSENIRYERNEGKGLLSGPIVDGQTIFFLEEGINTFFYLEDQNNNCLNGNWTINQTSGGSAYYAKSGIDQIMWNFPNNGNYTVVVAGINPLTNLNFSHTFYVQVGTPPQPTNSPVKWVSTTAISGGWQITMKFFLTPGGLGTTTAPYGYAWVNETQNDLYQHLPLSFTGDSTLVTFNIMNTNNNLYYTNNLGTRFKFTYLVKQQNGNGSPGMNGQWAIPTGNFYANNSTGAGQMFEFYINLTTGTITNPAGQVFGLANFNLPGKVGDNVFRAEKVQSNVFFWALYPTNLVNSVYKKAQYKIGLNGNWTNFPSAPTQWNNSEYFGGSIPYQNVSGVGDVFIRFGEEIGGNFTINNNSSLSPSYNSSAGGFSFR